MESVKVHANAHEPTEIRLTSCKRILSFHEGEVCRGQLKRDGARAETRFSLSTTGRRGVRISGSNAGYTMFRGSVKGTGYLMHLNQ